MQLTGRRIPPRDSHRVPDALAIVTALAIARFNGGLSLPELAGELAKLAPTLRMLYRRWPATAYGDEASDPLSSAHKKHCQNFVAP